MIPLQRAFLRIGAELDVDVAFDKAVTAEDGTAIVAPVHMPHFGGPVGILIFDASEDFWPQRSAMVALGYAYSVLGPRSSDEVDLPSTREMLEEWGWSGPENRKPKWLVRTKP